MAQKDLKVIIDLKEKYHTEICSWLRLENRRKIDYYLYSSIKEKKALMGDDSPGNAIWKELNEQNISKKFEIHVVYSEKCKFISEHEDMHLLSLEWGLSIYLFCEGLAQQMEDEFMGENLHLAAGRLLKEKSFILLRYCVII